MQCNAIQIGNLHWTAGMHPTDDWHGQFSAEFTIYNRVSTLGGVDTLEWLNLCVGDYLLLW